MPRWCFKTSDILQSDVKGKAVAGGLVHCNFDWVWVGKPFPKTHLCHNPFHRLPLTQNINFHFILHTPCVACRAGQGSSYSTASINPLCTITLESDGLHAFCSCTFWTHGPHVTECVYVSTFDLLPAFYSIIYSRLALCSVAGAFEDRMSVLRDQMTPPMI